MSLTLTALSFLVLFTILSTDKKYILIRVFLLPIPNVLKYTKIDIRIDQLRSVKFTSK